MEKGKSLSNSKDATQKNRKKKERNAQAVKVSLASLFLKKGTGSIDLNL
jgi:hypothetical protein